LQTIGQQKAELMKERIASINPECEVITLQMFYDETTAPKLFAHKLDYIVDAMDTVSAKIHVIVEAKQRSIPIISSMGAANKMDPTRFEVTDISKTSYDPIAKVLRRELKNRRICKGVKVVYSKEIPVTIHTEVREQIVSNPDSPIRKVRQPPASNAFVPSVAGLILASVVVRDLLNWQSAKG
jgi:tRNA A37 threonylcarbamoyladenosine dehydratase